MSLNNNSCNNTKNQLQQKISYICNNEYKYFLNKKNVVGIGLGYKIQNGFYTNQLCIQVFVNRKLLTNELNNNDIIPLIYKGIPTDVKETGYFTVCSLTQRIRPVLGGYSISSYTDEGFLGTAGCLVTNGVSKFVLSANHVIASLNTLPIGHSIVQPAFQYGGIFPNDTIAKLNRYVPLRFVDGEQQPINFSDCALGLLTEPNILSHEIALIGKLNGIKSAKLNERVRKVGATSELTEGVVTNINSTLIFTYPNNQRCLFQNQIFTTRMSDTGDSGSILVNKGCFGIGLLFARSDVTSVFSRLSTVLDQLDVQLITD